MPNPWEFHWYFNQLPHPKVIQSHHTHAILKYCNLSELYYAISEDHYENHRFEFPDWVEYIDLSYNTIYDFYEGSTIDYSLPKNLELLNVAVNKLSRLPERLPSTLNGLMCRGNQIVKLPKMIPKNIENINAGYNCLTEWKPNQVLTSLETLRLHNNRIRFFDWSSIQQDKLQILDISENQLTVVEKLPESLLEFRIRDNRIGNLPELPPQLEILEVSKNLIQSIGSFPSTLQVCLMAHNQLKEIDEESLMRCHNLNDLDYQGNPNLKPSQEFLDFIEERFHDIWVSGARQRALDALQKGEIKSLPPIYDDPQNVHHIDTSLILNVNRLMNENDHCLDPETKEELLEEAEKWNVPQDVRFIIAEEWNMRSLKSAVKISVGDLWKAFWGRIREMKKQERQSLLSILPEEVRQSHNVCYTGRIGRILGILQGFDEKIELNIPLNEQIVARYTACQRRLERKKIPEDSLTYLWELECSFTLELLELGIETDKRKEWLNPIQEQIQDKIENIGENWGSFWEGWDSSVVENFKEKKELFLISYSSYLKN